MPKKYAYLLFFFAVIVVLLPSIHSALALELSYPDIAGNVMPANPNNIQYVQYYFLFAIAIAGIIAVFSIVIAGLQILLSAGSAQSISDAKERIFGAIFGIILLFASVIILRTINTGIVDSSNVFSLPSGNLTSGVLIDTTYIRTRLADGGPGPLLATPITITTAAPQSAADNAIIPNLSRLTSTGEVMYHGESAIRKIRYACTPDMPRLKLLVWTYSTRNFQIVNNVVADTTRELPCNNLPDNTITITRSEGILSYRWDYQRPGVYLFLNRLCFGVSSNAYTTSTAISPFSCRNGVEPNDPSCVRALGDQTPKCMKFVNSQTQRWGAVLNQQADARGECSATRLSAQAPPAGSFTVTSGAQEVPNNFRGPSKPKFIYAFQTAVVPDGAEIRFQSDNLSASIESGDFDVIYGKREWRLSGEVPGGDLNRLLQQAAPGRGELINPAIPANPGECQNANVPCLKWIRTTTMADSSVGFRVILYTYNHDDAGNVIDPVCQMYITPPSEIDFGGLPGTNSNRWAFNHSRKFYDAYIIPYPQ